MTASLTRVVAMVVPPVAAGANFVRTIGAAPFTGAVTAVSYTPDAAMVGAPPAKRVITLYNRGVGAAKQLLVASEKFASNVSYPAFVATPVPLTNNTGRRQVVEGDILVWESVGAGSTVADPGGLVQVTMARGSEADLVAVQLPAGGPLMAQEDEPTQEDAG